VKENNPYQNVLRWMESPFNRQPEEVWPEVEARLSKTPVRPSRSINGPLTWAAAAAVVGAIVWLMALSPSGDTTLAKVATGPQETEQVTLPDQSKVSLGAWSSITFEKRWKNRIVNLDGLGYFEVEKGRVFTVQTPVGSVEVVGTSFSVTARPERFEVVCFSGTVRVRTESGEISLRAGESARRKEGRLVRLEVNPTGVWSPFELSFDNDPLVVVCVELERQFGVQIDAGEWGARRYTGVFSAENLEEALESICLPLGLNWTREGEKIRIEAGSVNYTGS